MTVAMTRTAERAGRRSVGEVWCGLEERGRTKAEILAGKVGKTAKVVGGVGGRGGGGEGGEDSRGKKGGLMGDRGRGRGDS
jgi:hypothetical protein